MSTSLAAEYLAEHVGSALTGDATITLTNSSSSPVPYTLKTTLAPTMTGATWIASYLPSTTGMTASGSGALNQTGIIAPNSTIQVVMSTALAPMPAGATHQISSLVIHSNVDGQRRWARVSSTGNWDREPDTVGRGGNNGVRRRRRAGDNVPRTAGDPRPGGLLRHPDEFRFERGRRGGVARGSNRRGDRHGLAYHRLHSMNRRARPS